MRTQEEILARIEERKASDILGFEVDEYVMSLDFEHVQPFLKKDHKVTEKEWNKGALLTDEALRERMIDYLNFAVEKVMGHRGISASRSVAHYLAWFWLLGDDEMVEFIGNEDNYPQYGAPIIAKAYERLGVELPDVEAFRRMALGENCFDDCEMGCGR